MLAVKCKCGKSYEVDERLTGRTVRCRCCGEVFAIRNGHSRAAVSTPPAIEALYSTPAVAASARPTPDPRPAPAVPDTLPEDPNGTPHPRSFDESALEY